VDGARHRGTKDLSCTGRSGATAEPGLVGEIGQRLGENLKPRV